MENMLKYVAATPKCDSQSMSTNAFLPEPDLSGFLYQPWNSFLGGQAALERLWDSPTVAHWHVLLLTGGGFHHQGTKTPRKNNKKENKLGVP